MRYPIIFLILAGLFMVMPTEKAKKDEKRSETAIAHIFSSGQQQAIRQRLDASVADLREMPPLHQVLVMTTFIILFINAAIVVSYLINSIAAITGIGLSFAAILPLLLLAILWRKPRRALYQRMKRHAEFGPFVSKFSTRMWKRRFRRAAREHGWSHQY